MQTEKPKPLSMNASNDGHYQSTGERLTKLIHYLPRKQLSYGTAAPKKLTYWLWIYSTATYINKLLGHFSVDVLGVIAQREVEEHIWFIHVQQP